MKAIKPEVWCYRQAEIMRKKGIYNLDFYIKKDGNRIKPYYKLVTGLRNLPKQITTRPIKLETFKLFYN